MTETKWSWRNEPELMARLLKLQNDIDHIDILTCAGYFTSHDELQRHVEHYEQRAAKH